ncbi:MAG: competence protein CoiA family protein [Cyanobacteria bacterium P01_A01_bin.17]
MPLKARLNGKEIAAYSYDDQAWKRLKAAYSKNRLQMACCDRDAVPKTSKLGTQYFAHKKKGDCATAPETKEHLFLKDLVARTATKYGWQVETESAGQTPDGEEWVADVLCSKRQRMAIEIQWSRQSKEEYEHRQQKYKSSDITCVWLYRLQGSEERGYKEKLDENNYELPAFGITQDKETGKMRVPQFQIGVEEFVDGLFGGRLKFKPKPGDLLTAEVMGAEKDECWHCNHPMNFVTGFDIVDASGDRLRFAPFGEDGVAELIKRHVPDRLLARMGYGRVRSRYIHNYGMDQDCGITCRNCRRNNGALYCGHKSYEWTGKPRPKPITTFQFVNGEEVDCLQGDWYFDGLTALMHYRRAHLQPSALT